jgi:hypothetical protein
VLQTISSQDLLIRNVHKLNPDHQIHVKGPVGQQMNSRTVSICVSFKLVGGWISCLAFYPVAYTAGQLYAENKYNSMEG